MHKYIFLYQGNTQFVINLGAIVKVRCYIWAYSTLYVMYRKAFFK